MDAVDNLGDAIDVTRNFLTPIRASMWLKLAIIVLFVSSLGGGFPAGAPTGDPQVSDAGVDEATDELDITADELVLALVMLAVIGLAFWLVLGFIGAILEFVFIKSLVSSEVHVRQYARDNLGRGIHLFGFRVAVSLGAGLLVAGPPVLLYVSGVGLDAVGPVTVVAFFGYALLVGLLYAVVRRFTSEFVAPVMLLQERGILDAWRRYWQTLRDNPGEYGVYLVLIWILQFVGQIAAGFVIAIAAIVLAIPFVIAMFVLFLLGPIGWAIAVFAGIFAFLLFLLLIGLVWTPLETYFKYYALLVLGDTDPELDLIPEQRAAVRNGPANNGKNWDKATDQSTPNDEGDWTDATDEWSDGDEEHW